MGASVFRLPAIAIVLSACVPTFRSVVVAPRIAGEISLNASRSGDIELWISRSADCQSRVAIAHANERGRFDFAETRERLLFETFGDPLYQVSLCAVGSSGAVELWSTSWVGPHEDIAPYWLRCTGHGCDVVATLESSKDLGFGFREVYREQTNPPGSWEGVGHFAFLYYKGTELNQTDIYSIAPSGHYALFQDGPTGDIVLFTRTSEQKVVVVKFLGSLAVGFKWAEERKEATVSFENGEASRVVLS